MAQQQPSKTPPLNPSSAVVPLSVLGIGVAILAWAYFPAFWDLSAEWRQPQYSHAYLVPLFALGILRMRREHLAKIHWGFYGIGLPLIVLAAAMRGVENYFYGQEWLDAISVVPFLAGLVLLVGGWPAARWAFPSIIFLVFMIPLPWTVEIKFSYQLQNIGTHASTFVLQTVGLPAIPEGNTIIINRGPLLDEKRLGVAEACSGLRMLLVFFALAMAVAVLMRGTWWERLLVFASAVPIALAANITRIAVTGILYVYSDDKMAEEFFHDWAGWLMMPFALILLWLELKLFARLFVEVKRRERERTAFPLFGARPRPSKNA